MPAVIHVVLLKLRESAPNDFVDGTLRPAALRMVGKMPGLKRVELGKPMELSKARSQGWDAMLYSELESEEALAAFATHEAHDELASLFMPYMTDVLVYDMQI